MSESIQDACETTQPVAQHNEEAHVTDAPPPSEDQPEIPEARPAPPEEAPPPEAQGEVNGGPLGCCLGVTVGLLLSLSLIILSYVFANPLRGLFQGNESLLGLLVRILMGLLAFALAISFGVLGWRLGKRFFREYEPPPVKERKRRTRTKTSEQNI
jgi:hypothetical protein